MTHAEVVLRRSLVRACRSHRLALSVDVLEAIRGSNLPIEQATKIFGELESWKQETIHTVSDLAIAWFERPERENQVLLEGWINAQLCLLHLHTTGELDLPATVIRVRNRWLETLSALLNSSQRQSLKCALDSIVESVSKPIRKRLRVLYVGDCLMPEIMTSLNGPCLNSQIALTQTFLHDHVPVVLRNQIRALDTAGFDLVFFSPFTHTFSSQYAQLLSWRTFFWPRSRLLALIDEMLSEALSTTSTLNQHFSCPVYVHNSAVTVQVFTRLSGLGKNIGAMRNRQALRSIIAQRVERTIKESSSSSCIALRLLDEASLRDRFSCWTLGRVFFKGVIFHPTRLGVELGRTFYHQAAFSEAFLATKKVVVCDLDNTLWDGVIGEGAVTHFSDRQRILKSLRQKGVLLSINSKNDPANVHFSGAVLQAEDFVGARVNWESKSANMAGIVKELNLKAKDFIFIDDRADELERVQHAFPELLTMNAGVSTTWELLSHWERHLVKSDEDDRTKMYQERLARETFVGSQEASSSQPEEAAALADLQIFVVIQAVSKHGLKRVAELINRTNQFNLSGSRTSVSELQAGLTSSRWVVTASAKDRFGNMGIVGAMQVDRKSDRLEIPIFVLSCRVFGLGIEYALLNSIKSLARPSEKVIGFYKETQFNEPCRHLYSNCGFSWHGDRWIGEIAELPETPEWLTVTESLG